MPLPDFLSTSNTFRQWLATTNNLISHVDNTSVYILASQNATPRVTTGNISVNGTITLGATTLNTTAYTGTSNNATYAFGKSESALNVNSAISANNTTYAFGKTEGALNVNSATTATTANNAT